MGGFILGIGIILLYNSANNYLGMYRTHEAIFNLYRY
jgi:hypothetical protein